MPPILYAVINSGQSLSPQMDLRQGKLHAVHVPTITSADLLIQGSFNTTSADFLRLQNVQANSGALTFRTGPGSVLIQTEDSVPWMPYVRLETSVNQADTRTLSMLVRKW